MRGGLTISALQTKPDIPENSVDPEKTAHMSRLIRIYTVSHSDLMSDLMKSPIYKLRVEMVKAVLLARNLKALLVGKAWGYT